MPIDYFVASKASIRLPSLIINPGIGLTMNQFAFNLTQGEVLTITFGEATHGQLLPCRHLAWAEFGKPLSKEDYVEQQQYLAQKPLVSDKLKGWRIWCLSLAHDPTQILTTCKTIPRELLIRDDSGMRRQKGYCIASVVTHPRYRGQGLATRLLKFVGTWLDGPGDAIASMLFTSIGDFYDHRGWKKLPAYLATLSWAANSLPVISRAQLLETRPLSNSEIPQLCTRDIGDIEKRFEELLSMPGVSSVSVLPTAELITWLHDGSDFTGTKIQGVPPKCHGSICEGADSWLYWFHDFRKEQLAIQRIRVPVETSQIHHDAIAAMLIDAIEEASRWNFPKVILWDPSAELLSAMQILQETFDIGSEIVSRENRSVPSFRWRDADESRRRTALHFNEFYTWS
ncbi:hypothetical protein F5Y09DRAFT_322862 [Xylaria sp. FL1042]|nr:hypothetical protein F5Y09DRAFT_322862 [Xylaria sp. FL1042]